MGQLFQELKRRNVIRVGVAYLAVSWLALQVAETLLPVYGFTDVAIRNIVACLGIGLIVALALAWSFEWTTKGIFKESDSDSASISDDQDNRRLDRFIMLALVAALAFFAIDKFVLAPSRDAIIIEEATEKGRADALLESKSDKSIAVLPFVNRSNRDDDVYFVDGIHDDILTQLAHIGALAVTSRTSVEQFRGTTKTVKEIALALGVKTLLEGGVQRAGDRVRINVQLIDATSDDHLWAETYERELTAANIFSVQADIAAKVADAMRAALLPDEEIALQQTPTESYAAYDLYLLGRFHWNQRTKESIDLAQGYFEEAIEQDPDFVQALSGLADSYSFQVIYGTLNGDDAYPMAEALIEKAMALDDSISEVWGSLGLLRRGQNNVAASEQAFLRATELDPENFSAWYWYSGTLQQKHRYSDALSALQTAYSIEPMSRTVNENLAEAYSSMGQFSRSREHFRRADQVGTNQALLYPLNIAYSYYYSGDFAQAIEASRTILSTNPESITAYLVIIQAYIALGQFDEASLWDQRVAALGVGPQLGFIVLQARHDYTGMAAYLENTLKVTAPQRNLSHLHALFRANFRSGKMPAARAYLSEYINAQSGRVEVSPGNVFQMTNLMSAAFLMIHGDAAKSEPQRGRELAEDIRTNLTTLTKQGWHHPMIFAALAGVENLLGNTGASITNLNLALDNGFRDQDVSLQILAFDTLHEAPDFDIVSNRLAELIAAEKIRLASIILAPYKPPIVRKLVAVEHETLLSYEGWYSDGNILSHVFIADDGRFMGTSGQSGSAELLAISTTEFYTPVDQSYTVQFVESQDSVTTHFLVKGTFGELLFKKVESPPPAIQLPRDVLAQFEGTYAHDRLGSTEGERTESDLLNADIYVDDEEKIWIDYDNQPKLQMQPVSETEMILIGFYGRLVFSIDPDTGKAGHFIDTQDGSETLFERQ